MGRLFLLAGSPARAADIFRGMLHDASANADAYAGLGEADFARGDYRAAQRDFQTALRLAPDDQAARQRLDLCNNLLMLDPTVRGLGPAERFRRSLKLVELTTGCGQRMRRSKSIAATAGIVRQGRNGAESSCERRASERSLRVQRGSRRTGLAGSQKGMQVATRYGQSACLGFGETCPVGPMPRNPVGHELFS